MAYRLLYDNQLLFDPYTDDVVTDAQLTAKINTADYLDFTMPLGHSLYNVVQENALSVFLYFDNVKLFEGYIETIKDDLEGNRKIACVSALSYLQDTRVRPYSTVDGEQPLKAPTSVEGYFNWLIEQHNKNVLDQKKRFKVGVNQGALLDENDYIYRSSKQLPSTAKEIEDKILDSLGGYLFLTYDGDDKVLNLYADAYEANTQIIDFGVNITDFNKTIDTVSQYTAIYPQGATPKLEEGSESNTELPPIDITSLPDGYVEGYSGIVKQGDVIYNFDAVQRYGYREYFYSNTDITDPKNLLKASCVTLNKLMSPSLTIEVTAVDLSLLVDDYEHLKVGQAARVRAKAYNVDEYLMINSIVLDFQDPGNTVYNLGTTYDTLTGQQSSYFKSLNAGINKSLDQVASLDQATKDLAKDAKEAMNKADQASQDASNASSKSDSAINKADEAITSSSDAISKAEDAATAADSAQSKANEAADAANAAQITADTAKANAQKAQDEVDTFKTDADAKYATKVSLTETASDLTINFDNKIDTINKYVRFVDGNVILGEAENPTTLKISNDHLDILNNTDVVAKFSESAIELGNKSYQSTIKLCKGLGTIQGFVYGENDSDPIIEIGASSGVRLHATRTIDAGHFSMGHFGILTSSDASNSETSMVSESYLRGDNSSVMKDAAISVYTSNTGDSVCRLSASKIQINGKDSFELTKLWSGNLSKGGSVNVIQGNQYTLFAVRLGGDGILMIGVKFNNQLHCFASYDSGSATYQYRASFEINDFTFKLTGASINPLNGARTEYTVTEIYGIF